MSTPSLDMGNVKSMHGYGRILRRGLGLSVPYYRPILYMVSRGLIKRLTRLKLVPLSECQP